MVADRNIGALSPLLSVTAVCAITSSQKDATSFHDFFLVGMAFTIAEI